MFNGLVQKCTTNIYNIPHFCTIVNRTIMYYDIICMNKQISEVIFINYYQRLRDLREDMELNQSMIAKILDTSQKQYSRWETGEYPIPFAKVIQLAKFYKVSIDYIAGLTNDKRGIGYKADSNSKYNITQQNNNSAVIKIKEK